MPFPDPAAKIASISVVLDRTEYVAGDIVQGTIQITARERIECTSILVLATGIERATWNHKPAPSVCRNYENVCFTQEVMVSPAERVLERGDHTCSFQFTLPLMIPGSLALPGTYTPTAFVKYASATIDYKLNATVQVFSLEHDDNTPPRTRELRTEDTFVVHEAHSELVSQPRETAFFDAPIRWCCFRRGKCDFQISIDTDVVFPGDHVQVECDINNDSSATIPAVMCRLIQITTLNLKDFGHTVEREVGAWIYREVGPHEHVIRPHVFTVESTHHHTDQDTTVSPTTLNGTVVQCRYVVQVEAYIARSADLELRLPLTVLSPQLQEPSRESSI